MSRHGARNGVPDSGWITERGENFLGLGSWPSRPLKQCAVFEPSALALRCLRAVGAAGRSDREKQELGLIIDLTFTSRYYEVQRAVRRFLRDNVDNDKLIGVHCTHGLNRTGYLICRYLIDVDGMDPKEAVELFNSSRGHAIERENYLDDLQRGPKRSNDGMEDAGQEPKRGHAARRPSDSDRREDRREDRRPHYNDSRNHRSSPPRRTNHRSYHHGLLPSPPLQHPPPMRAPLHQDHHPYRWTPLMLTPIGGDPPTQRTAGPDIVQQSGTGVHPPAGTRTGGELLLLLLLSHATPYAGPTSPTACVMDMTRSGPAVQ
ncbi:RNA/RNP complex-1-interacting phosphatase [Larimichthys crocea]|uniref:RNA/RNP complex-1-interacting phosphatase n=1 Tax=Larimichthys crocea TaxID=215358 RepID=A0A6G0I263_LARCR|nr:RNA/RNP complex-1-interacting phosphatase [Larimichthys crocea]